MPVTLPRSLGQPRTVLTFTFCMANAPDYSSPIVILRLEFARHHSTGPLSGPLSGQQVHIHAVVGSSSRTGPGPLGQAVKLLPLSPAWIQHGTDNLRAIPCYFYTESL
jgi:hypothetical protein